VCDRKSCAIICLGTELTRGLIQDRHSVFLSQELVKAGFDVTKILFIPDRRDIAKREVKRSFKENKLIIISGGLGPTSDDITRNIIADIVGKSLVFRKDLWEALQQRYPGRRFPESNRRQAFIPEGFSVIENPGGTACGFMGENEGCQIVVLPGPPAELQPMFLHAVVPLITDEYNKEKQNELVASAYMVSESLLEDEYQHSIPGDVQLQTRLTKDRIIFTLYGRNVSQCDKIFSRIKRSFGSVRIRKGNHALPELLISSLLTQKKNIVCAESCTGGLLGKWLTDIPGSSRVLWGSIVTYSNKAKEVLLGVRHSLIKAKGAVSKEVVSAMSSGALRLSDADISIAVSGIAGPEGGTQAKPVGTVWISVKEENETEIVRSFHFSGNRDLVRRKAAIVSFLMAESVVKRKEVLDIPAKW
jgi:nicotinamide-nucleotide amidase